MNYFHYYTRFAVIFSLFALAAVLTGCGHNAATYSDGVGVELGFIPEQGTMSVNFRYGKLLTAAVKEHSEVTLETDTGNTVGGNENQKLSGSTSNRSVFSLKTGDQITGYSVELEQAKHDPIQR